MASSSYIKFDIKLDVKEIVVGDYFRLKFGDIIFALPKPHLMPINLEESPYLLRQSEIFNSIWKILTKKFHKFVLVGLWVLNLYKIML
jgi:hypothetical protein